MKQQSGFTLIELIMVIVILGILAVTAMPKFTDLKREASLAALKGVGGSLTTGTSINFALQSMHFGSGVKVRDCNQAESALEGQALPVGYSIEQSAVNASAVTTVGTACSLWYGVGSATGASFVITGSN